MPHLRRVLGKLSRDATGFLLEMDEVVQRDSILGMLLDFTFKGFTMPRNWDKKSILVSL